MKYDDNPQSRTRFVREYNFYRMEDEFFYAKMRRANLWRIVDVLLFLGGAELTYWVIQHASR